MWHYFDEDRIEKWSSSGIWRRPLEIFKHGVSFHDAATAFGDPLAITYYDPAHSDEEDRYLTFGHSSSGRLLIVSHTDRGNKTRIISARLATRKEQKQHEQG